MTDETNLSGLDLATAREYVFGYMTSLKQLDQELTQAKTELALWTERAALATAKNAVDLKAAAEAKVAEINAKIASRESERTELAAKISRMREQLPMLRMTERTVDADRLLAELQLMTGELLNPGSAAAENDLRRVTADSALEELKRKMAGS